MGCHCDYTFILAACATLTLLCSTCYFWQITDFHYDSNYSHNGLAEYLCHQQPWPANSEYQTWNAGDGYQGKEQHGMFGDYSCDSPWSLVKSAAQAMKTLKPDVDFILWTGDSTPHVPDRVHSPQKAFTVVKTMTDLLLETFPDTTFYPTIGNHDSWPANQVPPDDQDEYYSTMAGYSGWHNMLDRESLNTFKKGGYYCSQNSQGLWQIGLNTMIWYQYDSLVTNLTDPADQFAWLETQLKRLEDIKAKVLLSGHAPPGYEPKGSSGYWYYPAFNRKFLSLMQQYSDVIVGLVFGHEHKDNLHIVYDDKGRAILPIFMAPAITPLNSSIPDVGANNPAIRLYKYSRTTGHILDFTQYYLDLTVANDQRQADWVVEYTPVEAYGIEDVTATSLNRLVQTFKQPQSRSFQKYFNYSSVSIPSQSDCDEQCKHHHFCAITCIDYDQYDQCLQEEINHVGSAETFDLGETLTAERSNEELNADSVHWNPHSRHYPSHDAPHYMYYILIAALVIMVVFVVVAAVCCCTQGPWYMKRRSYVLIVDN